MKLFNYIRVSTKEQNEARQIIAMQEWKKENNLEHVETIQLLDKATGTNMDRPNLEMLLKVVDSDSLVVIKSIDRLSRNYNELREIWNAITKKGADIVVIDMPLLDTRKHKDLLGNFVSDLILQILAYVAQQETEFRKKRQLEGIAAAKAKGKHLGRPVTEYPPLWEMYYAQWKDGGITAKEFMESVGLKRTTFYKLADRYKNEMEDK